ncbi:MAG: hypothetical protein WD181_01055 [Solirubrobacterales bacterium]
MQDSVLNEALKRLAAEASIRFTSLVATGDEIPFDVAENNEDSSHFYRYVPLTSNFIDCHTDELKSLPGYGPARGVVVASGVASPYLEARGLSVASDPEIRAEAMLEVFIRELWEGVTEFSLDLSRVESALGRLEVAARDIREAKVLIAPLTGFEMTPTEIELAGGIRIVQSDAVDAPLEATSSEGTERSAWQPAYLAMVPLSESPDGPRTAVAAMNGLVRALRIFKEGSAGLGPYAFAPVGEDAWRRIETGAAPTRPGSYFLIESEVPRLDEFMRRLADEAPEVERLAFAEQRFHFGLERARPLDALSDHLLAIRSALGGEGMIDAPLSARAAALITGTADNDRARTRIEAAMDLELSLINGEDAMTAGDESAAYLAAWVEDSARHILREAVLGNFGSNINVAAEETLITGGLLSGEVNTVQTGSTAEWEVISPGAATELIEERFQEAEIHVLHPPQAEDFGPKVEAGVDPLFGSVPEFEPESLERFQPMPEIEAALGITPHSSATSRTGEPGNSEHGNGRLLEPVPDPGEITVSAAHEIGASLREDWLSESRRGSTIEWPATPSTGSQPSRGDSHPPRDSSLFPSPGTTEWSVSELDYHRRRSS